MEANNHHNLANHVESQPDLSLPFSPEQGFEGGSEVRSSCRDVGGANCNTIGYEGFTAQRSVDIQGIDVTPWGFRNQTGTVAHPNAIVPGSYASNFSAGWGGLDGSVPLLPNDFASPSYGINTASAWATNDPSPLRPDVQVPATVPWSFIPQSPDFNTSPPLAESGFGYPDSNLGNELTNDQYGFSNEQPTMGPVDFGIMDAANPLHFNFGMSTASVAMPNAMSNPLPNFEMKTMRPTPGLSFNSLPAATSLSGPLAAAAPPARQGRRTPCNFPLCNKTFKRASDRKRHEDSVHLNVPGLYLCHIPGCPKSHGKGYKRADKVTEHLWKKHANLGYTRA